MGFPDRALDPDTRLPNSALAGMQGTSGAFETLSGDWPCGLRFDRNIGGVLGCLVAADRTPTRTVRWCG
jgi:hypothetical protein